MPRRLAKVPDVAALDGEGAADEWKLVVAGGVIGALQVVFLFGGF